MIEALNTGQIPFHIGKLGMVGNRIGQVLGINCIVGILDFARPARVTKVHISSFVEVGDEDLVLEDE